MTKMNKQNSAGIAGECIFKGETGGMDKGALVCDLLMLAICLWNQVRYGMDMMFLIVPLALIAVYLVMYGCVPEEYCFAESALEIRHRFRKTVCIPYDAMFNFEASERDSFINISHSNRVKLYHTAGKSRRLTVCRPCDVGGFTDMLKRMCPEFCMDEGKTSRLEVFLKK